MLKRRKTGEGSDRETESACAEREERAADRKSTNERKMRLSKQGLGCSRGRYAQERDSWKMSLWRWRFFRAPWQKERFMLEMELTLLSEVITAAVHAGGNKPNEGSGHDFVVLHAHFHRKQYTLLISAQITQQAGVELHHLSLMLALSASEEATASDEKRGPALPKGGTSHASDAHHQNELSSLGCECAWHLPTWIPGTWAYNVTVRL